VDEAYRVMQQQVRVVHILRHGMEAPMHQQPHGLIDDEHVDLVVITDLLIVEVVVLQIVYLDIKLLQVMEHFLLQLDVQILEYLLFDEVDEVDVIGEHDEEHDG
jgi:hypothetical protein